MERLLVNFSFLALIVLVLSKPFQACFEEERIGLLEIKAYILNSNCEIQDNLDSWVDDGMSNCCSWDRVSCNATSNHVTGIFLNSTTGSREGYVNMGKLCALNLSSFHSFEELQHLDLSSNLFNGFTDSQGFKRLSNLKKLEVLDFSNNFLNNSSLSSLGILESLKNLNLQNNRMTGPFPSNELGGLINLEVLDITLNQFNGNLSVAGICGLRSIVELGLSYNEFSGPLPQCIGNFVNLQILDLRSNHFTGNIQSIISKLISLRYVFLSHNQFEGLLSFSSLANHTNLEMFVLSENTNLELETENPAWIPTFQLNVLDLPNCNLNSKNRKFSSFLFYRHELYFLDLSYNRLVGSFPSWIVQNNSYLQVLNLKNNSFVGNFQPPDYKHYLSDLDISNNALTGQLPNDFGLFLSNLYYMNISNNGFHGNFPSTIGEVNQILYLDLSSNNFSGEFPESLFQNHRSLLVLMMSNNSFEGNIFPNNVSLLWLFVLDMSNNNFNGWIDSDIFTMPLLSVMDVSNNKLTGTIPTQLCDLRNLVHLDLSENKLTGSLPSCFNASYLEHLFLKNNDINGTIPKVLSASSDLVTLDLSENKFSGKIPSWISLFSKLRVMIFGGNELEGHVPNDLCDMRNLSILSLSNNLLNGSIPSCLGSIPLGVNGSEDNFNHEMVIGVMYPKNYAYYPYNGTLKLDLSSLISWSSSDKAKVEFVTKYRNDAYKDYILNSMALLDLSDNELIGEIPSEIGEIERLRSFNLSYNHLSGSIPASLSNLTTLESMDLQHNKLSGEIPSQLVKLNFLGTFNVSFNNLSGRVPESGQFGAFDETNYIGNSGLCGSFIHRSCSPPEDNAGTARQVEDDEDKSVIDMFWFYWSFSASYVTVLLGIFSVLYINLRWRKLWFDYVHECIYFLSGIELY